jgi:hypothetical protein
MQPKGDVQYYREERRQIRDLSEHGMNVSFDGLVSQLGNVQVLSYSIVPGNFRRVSISITGSLTNNMVPLG